MPVPEEVGRIAVDARRLRATSVVVAFLSITAVHALVASSSHALHLVHIAFGALYLVPSIAAAVWVSPSYGLVASTVAAVAYLAHAATAERGDPMALANHLAMAAVYLLVGSISAWLVHRADLERRRHAEAEARSEREAVVQSIASLSRALRSRDDGTADHSARVAELCVSIGASMGLSPERSDVLRLAGLMHDIGKIGVRDDVLLKPGGLSDEERTVVERHPSIAGEILSPLRGCTEIAALVVTHHEAPDGSGYPRGLVAEQLPADAGILRVADVFAALTEHRPYGSPVTPRQAIATMRSWAGKLDPLAVAALESTLDETREGWTRREDVLST